MDYDWTTVAVSLRALLSLTYTAHFNISLVTNRHTVDISTDLVAAHSAEW